MKLHINKDRRYPCCRHKTLCLLCVSACLILVFIAYQSSFIERKANSWNLRSKEERSRKVNSWNLRGKEERSRKVPPLIKIPNQNTFFFSAIIPFHQSNGSRHHAIVTLFDASVVPYLCCVLDQKQTLTVSEAKFIRQFRYHGTFQNLASSRTNVPYPARQLECQVNSHTDTLLSIALKSCSKDINQYKPIVRPLGNQGKLGICAKIAYNDSLKLERLVEWMEFQKMMGVDRVVVYTLDISEKVHNVFKLYSDFVTTVPYELPGQIIRSMRAGNRSFPQFFHDEEVAVFDCKERLSGFGHVAGIDFDEFLCPRSNETLKEFLQTTLARKHPKAGAFYFHQQFHITDWPPSNSEQPLTSLRFQNSVPPRWECQKFVYIPERTNFGETHAVFMKAGFSTKIIEPSIAVIHHYRACPASWKNCHTLTRLLDTYITRYRTPLVARVKVMVEKLSKGGPYLNGL